MFKTLLLTALCVARLLYPTDAAVGTDCSGGASACVTNEHCASDACACNVNFKNDGSNNCIATVCPGTDTCHAQAYCTSTTDNAGTCRCKITHKVTDAACTAKACTTTNVETTCGANAECSTSSECACSTGYSANDESQCRKECTTSNVATNCHATRAMCTALGTCACKATYTGDGVTCDCADGFTEENGACVAVTTTVATTTTPTPTASAESITLAYKVLFASCGFVFCLFKGLLP